MRSASPRQISLLVFITGLTAATIHAQSVSGTLTGRILDGTGAAAPSAKIAVVNEESGVSLQTEANQLGLYRVPALSPGAYRIEVEASGFQRLVRRGIVLRVSQVLEIDLVLQVGTVAESVEVKAAAPVIEAQSSSVGQYIERAMIENMPLPNRTAMAMLALSPAAIVLNGEEGYFGVAGGRTRNQSYSLDGGNMTNVVGLAVPQPQQQMLMEAVQEFRLIANSYSAEHGHSTGGVVTLSTRAGTNDFRGSVYYFGRNDALDARNFFSASKTPLHLHQFGASLGGPVRKDKTHFFATWEQWRRISSSTVIQTLPSDFQQTGDFSGTLNAAGARIPIYDPATTAANRRQPFPNNAIPADRFDPVSKAITAAWPRPNQAGSITGANNFIANSRSLEKRNSLVGRLDHQLSSAGRLLFRYTLTDAPGENAGVWGHREADPNALTNHNRNQGLLAGHTHIFNSGLINEFRFNFNRRRNQNTSYGIDQDLAGKLGLKGVSKTAYPLIRVTGYAPIGRANHFRYQTPIVDTQWQNAISYYRGVHAFKAGVEYRTGLNQDNTDNSSSGQFGFDALMTGQPGTAASGNAFATFLLGEAGSAVSVRPDIIRSKAAYWAAYIQDDWRLTDQLTLNLGLRWEMEIPRTVVEDRMNAFDINAINPVSGTPGVVTFAGRDSVPRSAYNADFTNWGPRVGFAYRLPGFRNTVLRGGGGIFYGSTVSNVVATAAALGFSTNVALASPQPGIVAAMRLREGLPAQTRPPLNSSFGAVRPGQQTTTSVSFFDRSRPTPMSLQYNLNVQHEIRENLLAEVGYMANLGHHLTSNDLTLNQVPPQLMGPGNAQIRRPYPHFTDVSLINPPVGNSSYHGVYVKSEKRYASGLTFVAHYTFSKFIDDSESFQEYGNAAGYMDAYNRRLDKSLSASDVPHRVLISTVYAFPSVRGMKPLSTVLGGWKAGVIASFQSGPPFSVTNNANTTNAFSAGPLRPNLTGIPALGAAERTLDRWFNTAAFGAPAPYTFGNSPRAVLRGAGIGAVDLSLMKSFLVTERIRPEFRGEFFNLTNHTNFGVPGSALGTPAFGTVRGARPARVVQFGLRIPF